VGRGGARGIAGAAPPPADAGGHLAWFDEACRRGGSGGSAGAADDDDGDGDHLDGDDATERSLVAFVSSASKVGMIPLYDLLNHHNGKRNAKLIVPEEGLTLVAVVGGTRDCNDGEDDNSDGRRHHHNDVINEGDEIALVRAQDGLGHVPRLRLRGGVAAMLEFHGPDVRG